MSEGVPRTSLEIDNRMNEIAFNASLMHDMRAFAFVQRLMEQGAPYPSPVRLGKPPVGLTVEARGRRDA